MRILFSTRDVVESDSSCVFYSLFAAGGANLEQNLIVYVSLA
jgi:hypothetical protein